jgi:hypothetical protein
MRPALLLGDRNALRPVLDRLGVSRTSHLPRWHDRRGGYYLPVAITVSV